MCNIDGTHCIYVGFWVCVAFRPVVFEELVLLLDCCSATGMIKPSDVTDTAAAVVPSLRKQRAVATMVKAGKTITAQDTFCKPLEDH